jgi:UDP-N-acetylmuramyl pentapeptide phosphotransferase/UDP-N-acetylglucosamine-1-phosphate transferase
MTTLFSVDHAAVTAAGAGVVAFAVTALTVPVTIRLARRLGVVDEPGARSSHVIATPRLGGIGDANGALEGLLTAA